VTRTRFLQVNEYGHLIAHLSRRLKATVSELSVYQANAMQLQQEKDEMVRLPPHHPRLLFLFHACSRRYC